MFQTSQTFQFLFSNSYTSIKKIKILPKKEAQLYISLDHPNILKAREFFFFNKEKYLTIILEYCPEGSLCSVVGKNQNNSLKKILKSIAEGLAYLHKKGIIHRDIKPENILLLKGQIKIAGLEIAKIMSTSGSVLGRTLTPYYEAIKVLHEERYTCLADVWSFGILAFELLCERRIFQIMKGKPALQKDFPSASELSEIKDEEMREMVKMVLKKKPNERLTAEQVVDFLNGNKMKPLITEKQLHRNSAQLKNIAKNNSNLVGTGSEQKQKINAQTISPAKKIKLLCKNAPINLLVCQITKDLCQQIDNRNKKIFFDQILKNIYFPNLHTINLWNNQITDADLKALAENSKNLPNLNTIDLRDNQITDARLKALAENSKNLPNLQKILLGRNQITDAGFKAIAVNSKNFPKLHTIDLVVIKQRKK